jgi:hypothetical protein
MAMRWEYLRLQADVHDIRASDVEAEQLGKDGWELVAVVESAGSYIHMWFKRPRTGS